MKKFLYSKTYRLNEKHTHETITFWKEFLEIDHDVVTERISPYQVINSSGQPGCSLVGVVYDKSNATIYHTRALTGEDIIHELLHVAHPDWDEAEVVSETECLVNWAASEAKAIRLRDAFAVT